MIPLPDAKARLAFFEKALARPEMEHELSGEELGMISRATEGELGCELCRRGKKC
jgi:hypothetical protein